MTESTVLRYLIWKTWFSPLHFERIMLERVHARFLYTNKIKFGLKFFIRFTSSYKDEVRRSPYRLSGQGQFFRYRNETLTHHFGFKHALSNDIFNAKAVPLGCRNFAANSLYQALGQHRRAKMAGEQWKSKEKKAGRENMPLPSSKNPHFQNEARLGVQPFLWKWVLLAWEWKMISISKAEHPNSFWNRGPGEHGNRLLESL